MLKPFGGYSKVHVLNTREQEDEEHVSRSSAAFGWTALVLLGFAALFLLFGKRYPSLNGSPAMNVVGWILGAVAVPVNTIIFRRTELRRSSEDEAHISSASLATWLTISMVIGVLLAWAHGFFLLLERR